MRCGYCMNGKFNMKSLEISRKDDYVIKGYYFCQWCKEHKSDDELIKRVEQRECKGMCSI